MIKYCTSRLGHKITSNLWVALLSLYPTTKLLLHEIVIGDEFQWALFFAAARAALGPAYPLIKLSATFFSPFQFTCSSRVKMFCFSSATLKMFKSKGGYATFYAEEHKMGACQCRWFWIALNCTLLIKNTNVLNYNLYLKILNYL